MGEIILQAKNIDKSFSNGKTKLSVLKDFFLGCGCGPNYNNNGAIGFGENNRIKYSGHIGSGRCWGINYQWETHVHDMNETELSTIRNRDIGFVFQFHHLLPEFSAIENILMPTWINGADDRRDRALDLIEKMGLSERKDHFPSQLSGGERSRVAVARALMNKPKLVLADEPTGNLDEKNANKLIDLLGKINKDFHQAIVLTTHNPKIARIGHKQFFLENGSLSEKA